jgi:hypothetical protein
MEPGSVEEEASFQNTQKSVKGQKHGHGYRRDPKPRFTVLARASSNLTDRPKWLTNTLFRVFIPKYKFSHRESLLKR